MCGICGIINAGPGEPVKESVLRSMCSVLAHRGPDEEGVYLSGDASFGMGMRRLSVIDLETGSQPMSNESRTVHVAANGEIYNFKQLRGELAGNGHRFRSRSDTEVIVHLYEEFGIELLRRLRGPFAFCLWDEPSGKLFLARDRVGKRPLYYTVSEERLVFASEIKSILRAPGAARDVDMPAVRDYLTYQYVPPPRTAFKNIKKLPPAHYLEFSRGSLKKKKYWELDFSKKPGLSERGYCRRLKEIFEESVKLRLVSDVPLGAFLSGGLDSSIVVAVMSGLMKERVKTFSVGFEESGFSELGYARLVAEKFNTEHREYVVSPDVEKLLPKLVWHYDEPYSDSSAVPSYYVAKMASSEVKAALNGDGGDENFAGYPRHKAVRLYPFFDALPADVRALLGRLSGLVPGKNPVLRKAGAFLETLAADPAVRHARYVCIYDARRQEKLLSNDFKMSSAGTGPYRFIEELHRASGAADFLDRMLAADILSYLPGDLLVKMDVATMANSLEGRSPFLDHEFMEFAAGIPPGLKLKGFCGKYILKKAYRDIIPPEVLKRHKMGFGVPVAAWLRKELREMFFDTVLSERALKRGYFNAGYLKGMVSEHMEQRADHGYRLWSLLMLELWHRVFIDGGGGV